MSTSVLLLSYTYEVCATKTCNKSIGNLFCMKKIVRWTVQLERKKVNLVIFSGYYHLPVDNCILIVVILKEGLAGPSFGMTTTKILKEIFLQHMPHITCTAIHCPKGTSKPIDLLILAKWMNSIHLLHVPSWEVANKNKSWEKWSTCWWERCPAFTKHILHATHARPRSSIISDSRLFLDIPR